MDKIEIIIYIASGTIGGLVTFCAWTFTIGRKFQVLDSLKDCFGEVRQDFKELREKVETCLERISALEAVRNAYAVSGSPIKLSKDGIKILKLSQAQKMIDDNLDFLIKELEKKTIKSALDVHRSATVVLYEQEDQDFMKPIKDFVYENPRFENKDLTYQDMIGICSIYLRDKYLEKNPELLPGSSKKI